ncbi:delta-60 repeat domain-containing protein [Actinomadura sp. WMMB 499]|uniref:delta-60 repeat domain-containing protein n=1 Tax=Actinomadura sp. WMMB 499 TaxID=1219491 RepID=UPI0012458313|nr:delta-60 repeat domain-containing protein [Actinomadura sp. WMMB 499]QFG24736.1 hypothetical protein F7P10_29965 [Actinomadura sp. WMMB 499]
MRKRYAAAATLLGAALLFPAAASADIAHPAVVSADPVDATPHVLDGTVRAVAVVGSTVVVGGNFEQVRNAGRSAQPAARANLFAFSLSTGKITAFAPNIDGTVYALQPGPDGTVYVGGRFKNVGGVKTGPVARVQLSTGKAVTSFKPGVPWGRVSSMVRRENRLYIGGTFTQVGKAEVTGLARLNATTGALDPTFDIALGSPRAGELKVQNLIVNPQDTRMVINGTFTRAEGQRRYQIAMIDTAKTAKLSTWSTEAYTSTCNRQAFDTYMRGMDFSPDGSYFVVTTTGGPYGPRQMCDTAARWETGKTGSGQKATWINHTGGDTLLSTAVTGAAVYVGGHQRWMDNPYGSDSPGPGAVARPGIAALNPKTGKALSWNPTRSRGHGVEALVATPKGLFVGSDTDELGREFHGRIGMFPLP